MTKLLALPPEILEQVLLELDPMDVANASQSCRILHDIVYDPANELFWRKLYLRQPFDDPRECTTPLGFPLQKHDYKFRLQALMRARTVVHKPQLCRLDERVTIVQTLLDMALYTRPLPNPASDELSLNLVWLAALLRSSAFLDIAPWSPTEDEIQLRAHLRTLIGPSPLDYQPQRRLESRAAVYALDRYSVRNSFGPFLADGSGHVNWEQLYAVHHVVAMHVVGENTVPDAWTIIPLSMPFTQGIAVSHETMDWAGVSGRWQFAFCFIDHRQLLGKCFVRLVIQFC